MHRWTCVNKELITRDIRGKSSNWKEESNQRRSNIGIHVKYMCGIVACGVILSITIYFLFFSEREITLDDFNICEVP